mgnify:CR=1 FL=1
MAWDDTAKILQEEAADATEVVIELIQQRLKELPALTQKVDAIIKPYRLRPDGSRRKAAELKAILKTLPANVLQEYEKSTKSIYRIKEYLKDEVGNLNRALGELVTAKGQELYLKEGGLFDKLFPKGGLDDLKTFTSGIYNEQLAKNLSAFETDLSSYTDTIKSGIKRFTVGHHQHLASLRELALEAKKRADPKWWAEYTRLLADRGFEIGDKGILRLSRQAHKHLLKYKSGPMAGQLNIDGFLKDLGITEKTPGFKQLYEATQNVMAHAGGTGGVKIPPKFALLSPEKALNASLPILEVERAQSQGGEILTNVIRNWSNRIKEGGGEVTEEAINKLTRLTNRLGETLIGTTDGKPNLSFEQFDEKGRLARNVVLEQLKELEQNAVSSGFMDSAIDKAADLAEEAKYQSMAGPVKIFNEGSLTARALEAYQKLPTPVKFGTGLFVAGAGLDIHDIHAGGVQAEQEEGDTLESKYRQAAGRLRQTSGALGLGGAGTSIMTNALKGQAIKQGIPLQPKGLSTKIPITGQMIKGGNLLSSVAGLSSVFTGLTAWRAEYLADREARRTRRQKIQTGEIPLSVPENLEIKKTEPRIPNLPYLK